MLYKIKQNINYIILPCFAFPVLFGFFWPAYLIALAHSLFKINLEFFKKEKKSIIIMTSFFLLKFLQAPSLETIVFLKTFAGLGFFYFYFCYFNKINLDKILIASMAIYLPLEFLYKNRNHLNEFRNIFWLNHYPRPLGLAENTTVMTIILIIFLLILGKYLSKKWNVVLIFSVLFCMSGMGYLGLIYAFLVSKIEYFNENRKKALTTIFILGLIYIIFYVFMQKYIKIGGPLDRISPRYILFLLDMKYKLIVNSFSEFPDYLSVLIGLPWNGKVVHSGSDFGWGEIIFMSGISGVILNLLLINNWIKNKEVKLFLLLSIFHYNALWFPGGQIFLGYILGRYSYKNISKDI